MVKVKLLFFASCRDIVGVRDLELEVDEDIIIADLKEQLIALYPRLRAIKKVLSVAVNAQYVHDAYEISSGDEIAFIPPVSGG
jgi:molybdopterin converting factor subunit 1